MYMYVYMCLSFQMKLSGANIEEVAYGKTF